MTEANNPNGLASRIDAAMGHVPDFPFKGFLFRDVTPLLEDDPALFRAIVEGLTDAFRSNPPDCIVSIESFGYIFGAPMAFLLGSRLVLARRGGKLPRDVHQQSYDMIYAGGKTLEVHRDAIRPGDRALIVDDVLASGGSVLATLRLIEESNAKCIGIACVAEVAILRNAPTRVELDRFGVPVVAMTSL